MSDIRQATSPYGNFIVHAAAGTGKTWLLTSRIIRLLLVGAPPGSILAISFTRKAAAEIQERILARLLDMAACDEDALDQRLKEIGCEPDIETRKIARDLYEKVLIADQPLRVTTFHAFCQDVLQRFPLESGIPPGFQIIESTTELENLAWRGLESELRKKIDPELIRAMDTLLHTTASPAGARAALMAFLDHRSDWWAFTENAADAVAVGQQHCEALLSGTVGSASDNKDDERIWEQLRRYATLLAKHDTPTNLGHSQRIEALLQAPGETTELVCLRPGLFIDTKGRRKSMKSTGVLVKKLGQEGAEELIRLHDEIADALDELEDRRRAQRNLERNAAWLYCGQALLDKFQSLKRQQQLLDFSDLEWFAYKLLTDSDQAQWVQYKLDQRIDHLLVDEFQDTNPTQWHLIRPLLDEMAAGQHERHRSAFIVGDVKQSIYRFRRAASDLFHHAHHWLLLNMEATAASQQKSYRSSPAVIEFVNLVFHQEDPNDNSHYQLHDFTRHQAHHTGRWGQVEVLPLVPRLQEDASPPHQELRNPLTQPRSQLPGISERQHEQEALMIADKINKLIGQPVTEQEHARPLEYGDIMILLRSRTHAATYEDALRKAGIPFSGSSRSQFLVSVEVQDILHLLRALISPFDNLALATALRSPVFSCTNEALCELASNDDTWWWGRLADKAATLPESHMLARAYRLLSSWQRRLDKVPVHDLLDGIYADANIVERYLSATPGHLRSRVESNLNRLLELALEADAGRYPSLTRFVASVSAFSGDDISSSTAGDESRVRILTIHAAKGLEAPVVFVADAARPTSELPASFHTVVDWPASADRPKHFLLVGKKDEQDVVSRRLLEDKQLADRREEANLLYVALTRASQYLYISGCEPKSGNQSWYHFITTRLVTEQATLAEPQPGFTVHFNATPEASSKDTLFVLSYGQAGELVKTTTTRTHPDYPVDDRLKHPVAEFASQAIINPSAIDEHEPGTRFDNGLETAEHARRRGTWIHRALELLPQLVNREQIYQRLRLEGEALLEEHEFETYWQQACRIVDDPRFKNYFDAANYLSSRNEMPILYSHKGNPVYGIIDRVVLSEKQAIVIDYKTHASATRENIDELARPYAEQMRFYGEGVKKIWPGKEVKLVLLFTQCAEVVEVPYPADA